MHGIKKYTAKNMKVIHIAPVKTAKVLGSNVLTAEGLSNSVFNLIEAQNRNDIDAGLLTLKKPAIDAFFNETLYNESIVSLIFPNFYLEIVKKFGEPDVVHSHDIYSVKQLSDNLDYVYHKLSSQYGKQPVLDYILTTYDNELRGHLITSVIRFHCKL